MSQYNYNIICRYIGHTYVRNPLMSEVFHEKKAFINVVIRGIFITISLVKVD